MHVSYVQMKVDELFTYVQYWGVLWHILSYVQMKVDELFTYVQSWGVLCVVQVG